MPCYVLCNEFAWPPWLLKAGLHMLHAWIFGGWWWRKPINQNGKHGMPNFILLPHVIEAEMHSIDQWLTVFIGRFFHIEILRRFRHAPNLQLQENSLAKKTWMPREMCLAIWGPAIARAGCQQECYLINHLINQTFQVHGVHGIIFSGVARWPWWCTKTRNTTREGHRGQGVSFWQVGSGSSFQTLSGV